MPEINLIDFFTYYRGETHQKEAVQLLQSAMPDSLLKNKSWVKWRETPEPSPSSVPPQCLDMIASFEDFELRPICVRQVWRPSATALLFTKMVAKFSCPTRRSLNPKPKKCWPPFVKRIFGMSLKTPFLFGKRCRTTSAALSLILVSTLARGSTAPPVSQQFQPACETKPGMKCLPHCSCTETQDQLLRKGSADAAKQREPFGLRKAGYGRTPNNQQLLRLPVVWSGLQSDPAGA